MHTAEKTKAIASFFWKTLKQLYKGTCTLKLECTQVQSKKEDKAVILHSNAAVLSAV